MAKHNIPNLAAKPHRHAARRAVHHRQRSGRAFLLLRHEVGPDRLHGALHSESIGRAGADERRTKRTCTRIISCSASISFRFFGAIIADGWLGKYRTILSLSIVYCLGNLTLACMATTWGIAIGQRTMLAIGLFLICLGAGGIKPCVSANVGDQFGESNKHLLSKMFGWFYFSINAGSFISSILCPWLLAKSQVGTAVGRSEFPA